MFKILNLTLHLVNQLSTNQSVFIKYILILMQRDFNLLLFLFIFSFKFQSTAWLWPFSDYINPLKIKLHVYA